MPTRMRRRLERLALPAAGLAVVLTFFEVAPRVGILPAQSFPPFSQIVAALADLVATGELWEPLRLTLGGWAAALGLAALVAIPLGMVMGASEVGALVLRVPVEFLRPIPSVALIPVLILVFGTQGSGLKVVLGVYGATFPLLFQASYGIADVDPVARDTTRAFGLGRLDRVRHLVVPTMSSYLATGLRLSAAVALILVVTGEYIVGVPGLGREVLAAQSSAAYDRMYALILATGLLGLAVNVVLEALERRVLHWHPSHRGTAGAMA